MFGIFARIFERTLRHDFHAVRIANRPAAPVLQAPQLVVYSNHPSWWDGVVYLYLARRLFTGRRVYTPIDAAMLDRYGFLRRVGAFGIEQGRVRGAIHFLEACRIIFADADNLLLITAQGRFADPRERPLRLHPGIAHVSDIAPRATFLPLAIEYTHWLEKQPELLLRFGEPVAGEHLARMRAAHRLERFETALTVTMDALAEDSIARNGPAFETILSGQANVNSAYDLWRRLKALASGRAFRAGHGAQS
jgi:1-acyl-sn-glycerol-3-phosphate acyltransferase